jgi:hypothetical protein
MPSRRTRKIMIPKETKDVATLDRGRHWTNDFKMCICGHSKVHHVMDFANYGGCTVFDGTKYCSCRKFEEKS